MLRESYGIMESEEMESTSQKILDKADCISFCTNTFKKGMNPNLITPAMDK